MPSFLIHFSQSHEEFRLPELHALSKLHGIPLKIGLYSLESPFLIVEIRSVQEAEILVSRAVLIKEIILLFASAECLDNLLDNVKTLDPKCFEQNSKFKFSIETFGSTISLQEQISLIDRFSFLPLNGEISLKDPQVVYSIVLDYGLPIVEKSSSPQNLYFGKWICKGGRDAINRFDLKKRKYLGITSMDAELSLVMANQALIKQDSLVFDPFVGTGGFLVSGAHFGGFTIGSDIDGRQIKGKEGVGIEANVEQYSLQKKVLGNVVCDFAHHPWVENREIWDAIMCDPPYGVRAGAKKITFKSDHNAYKKNGDMVYPEMVAYEMNDILQDLVDFSAKYLVVGGRLV